MPGVNGKGLATSHDAESKNISTYWGGTSDSVVGASTRLDENLWGTLQQHVCLTEHVYSRLPFEDFFNLRVVCKEWYNIACKRLALDEYIRKPFFLLFMKHKGAYRDCCLRYDARKKSWEWKITGLFLRDKDYLMAETEDVSFRLVDKQSETHNMRGAAYCISGLSPILKQDIGNRILGIMSYGRHGKRRYSSAPYKVVCGGLGFDTQVYDSKTSEWETKRCRPKPEAHSEIETSTGCTACRGRVYIMTAHKREIFVYDFDQASWSCLKGPPIRVCPLREQYRLDSLGTWNERVFDVAECNTAAHMEGSVCVWELTDESTQKWDIYARMPRDLYLWLQSVDDKGWTSASAKAESITIQARFCGDYVLVYLWDLENGGPYCLFNMITKNWEKLDVRKVDVSSDKGVGIGNVSWVRS